MKKLIILGSSRQEGDTKKIVDEMIALSNWNFIDLNDYTFSYYDYEHQNQQDDYRKLIETILDTYEVLIFATPVYWYAMSGIMKVFFDRITDLLDADKAMATKFRTKSLAIVTSSNGNNLGGDFWIPFKKTAKYLGMNYLGGLHIIVDNVKAEDLRNFITLINKQTAEQ